jgi:hypothetical protein
MSNEIVFSSNAASFDNGTNAVLNIDTINTTLAIAPSNNKVHRVVGITFQSTTSGIMRIYSGTTVIFTRTYDVGSFDFAVSRDCPLIQSKPGEALGIQFSALQPKAIVAYYSF